MEKTNLVEIIDVNGNMQQHIIIENINGSFTSMLKSTYDEQQAALSE